MRSTKRFKKMAGGKANRSEEIRLLSFQLSAEVLVASIDSYSMKSQ